MDLCKIAFDSRQNKMRFLESIFDLEVFKTPQVIKLINHIIPEDEKFADLLYNIHDSLLKSKIEFNMFVMHLLIGYVKAPIDSSSQVQKFFKNCGEILYFTLRTALNCCPTLCPKICYAFQMLAAYAKEFILPQFHENPVNKMNSIVFEARAVTQSPFETIFIPAKVPDFLNFKLE